MSESSLFKGPLVLFKSKSRHGMGGLFTNARIQTIGDTSMFVGQITGNEHQAFLGLTYWFPMTDADMIVEFTDEKQAFLYYAEWKKRHGENGNT